MPSKNLINLKFTVTLFICVCLSEFTSSALAAAESVTPPAAPQMEYDDGISEDDYRLGPNDLLEISVFRVEDFSRVVRVSATGDISLPLIGRVAAAGLTTMELEQQLATKLNETYLQNPSVSVFIKEYVSQQVTVEGSVNKPGVYPLVGRTTLLQILATAQGLADLADPERIQISRPSPTGEKQAYFFNIDDIRVGRAPDPIVKGSDVIVVHASGPKSVVKGIADTLRGFIQFGHRL